MTQALNLANFANNLNTAGATSNSGLQNSSVTVTAGTGMSGGGAVALGSSVTLTNAGVTSVAAGTGISVSGSTGAVTISASGGGTVTSVATGNGLQGGTITSSGTLSVACPTTNTVGSYALLTYYAGGCPSPGFGVNKATGGGYGQFPATALGSDTTSTWTTGSGTISGTWKWMSGGKADGSNSYFGLACRVA